MLNSDYLNDVTKLSDLDLLHVRDFFDVVQIYGVSVKGMPFSSVDVYKELNKRGLLKF